MGTTSEREAVVSAAKQLLKNRHRHGTEGNVQSDVEALLRAMQVGTIESRYQIGNDQADIYLPNRRAFIECKAYPLAADPEKPQARKGAESAREQLERYMRAEIESEMRMLPGLLTDLPPGDWTGIVTDGTHWHIYRVPHELNARCDSVRSVEFTNEDDALTTFLIDVLGGEMLGKEWIPEKPGELFFDLKLRLDRLFFHLPKKAHAPTRTKRQLWLDMMQTSGMVPADERGQTRLFLAHSFLIVIVRLVSHSLRGKRPGAGWRDSLRDGFASWVLDFHRGEAWASRMWEMVDGYDWQKRKGDVLRDLYQRYVSEQDRKVFGEFYTPDWLAALMVEEVLDQRWLESATEAARTGRLQGVGVLDPACGSGTFLYHAALRILELPAVKALRPVEQSNVVARLVNGMDIHPVAVEIARVNLERALPGEPTEGASAFRVFLGDSLQWNTRGEMFFGHTEDAMRLTTPRGRQALIPMEFVQSPSFAENFRKMVNAATDGRPLPPGIASGEARDSLESCHSNLTEIIEEEGDSVWTWYAVNIAGPHLLAQRKIDRIVGNPPWVRLADIQVDDRKRAMEDLGAFLELQAGGKMAPHLDIASYFILRTRAPYAANPGKNPAAWLVKKSAIRSGQWARFREKHAKTLAQSVDLEKLNPFGGGDATRCCVLFECRRMAGTSSGKVAARRTSPRRAASHEALNAARGKFEFVEVPEPLPKKPSYYDNRGFRQGATIVPHVLALIASKGRDNRPGQLIVETRRSRHRPWSEIPVQVGSLPEAWVRPVLTSPDLLPYLASREPPMAIISVDRNGMLHHNPGRDCPFWRELDEIYDAHRGRGQGTPETLLERFDYSGSLRAQPLSPQRGRRMVMHPGSGDIMRAARSRAGVAVVDSTLYWLVVGSEAEAGYLVALLNAGCLSRAFAECKESGRHFNLHPWRKVPIPRYDRANPLHRRLAELCASAEEVAARTVDAALIEQPKLGQPGLSSAIRQALMETREGQEVERIAARLLPRQAV